MNDGGSKTIWSERDVLAFRRWRLIAADRSTDGEKKRLPGDVLEGSVGDRQVFSIYRYTRGINDLSNPEIGYGETTREFRRLPDRGQLRQEELVFQRTRSGRQQLIEVPEQTLRSDDSSYAASIAEQGELRSEDIERARRSK